MRLKDYGRNHKERKEYIHQSGLLLDGVDVCKAKHDAFMGALEGARSYIGFRCFAELQKLLGPSGLVHILLFKAEKVACPDTGLIGIIIKGNSTILFSYSNMLVPIN